VCDSQSPHARKSSDSIIVMIQNSHPDPMIQPPPQ
jgi:hypothetical protein